MGHFLFTISWILGLGILKAVYSYRGQSLISTTLDWGDRDTIYPYVRFYSGCGGWVPGVCWVDVLYLGRLGPNVRNCAAVIPIVCENEKEAYLRVCCWDSATMGWL
jgi:hypothetical protein